MAIPQDPTVALVAYLAANADVVSLAGTRVYGSELPDVLSASMPMGAVVIQDAGGFGRRGQSPQYNQRVDVVAYGATPAEAKQLQLACTNALITLKRVVIGNVIIYSILKETGPYPGRVQVGLWPFSFSVFSIESNYQAVI